MYPAKAYYATIDSTPLQLGTASLCLFGSEARTGSGETPAAPSSCHRQSEPRGQRKGNSRYSSIIISTTRLEIMLSSTLRGAGTASPWLTCRRQLWQTRDLLRSNHALMSLATESRVLSHFSRHHKSSYSDEASSSLHLYFVTNDFSSNYYNFNPFGPSWIQARLVHSSSTANSDESDKPSSKVEETVKNIKQDLKDKQKEGLVAEPKRSLWKRIEDEILHYYHGFRLLYVDTKISIALIWRILNGHSLTRREHRQLIRTSSDLFRLVPFSVFIIVPFMELLLPVFLKFFPGMLPSTFQTKNDRENKMKAQLKVKLEMAKFLQKTLDDMSLESKGHSSEKAKEFAQFFHKIRSSGEEVSNLEILKFSKLFEDEITLDSLSRQQLTALCRVLEIAPIGNNALLGFQLRMRLRSLVADDKTIEVEGIEKLNVSELQMACKARGMRAVGVAEDRLRRQLQQWLQLSLHEKVPPSLLLLSRAMYLPEDLPTSAQLQATIQALPDAAALQAKAAIGEREGKLDHKTRIEVIKEEERKILEERREALLEEAPKRPAATAADASAVEKPTAASPAAPKEPVYKPPQPVTSIPVESKVRAPLSTELHLSTEIRDDDPISVAETIERRLSRHVPHPEANSKKEGLNKLDLDNIEQALEKLGAEKEKYAMEKEDLRELKSELREYREDVSELHSTAKEDKGFRTAKVKETKAAKRLYKRVNSMISKMDEIVNQLQREGSSLKTEMKDSTEVPPAKQSQLIHTEELIDALQRFQNVSDPARLELIADVVEHLDADRDGQVEIEDVMKVIEMIARENVKLNPTQIAEIVEMMTKEELLNQKISGKDNKENKENKETTENKDKSKDNEDPPKPPPTTGGSGSGSTGKDRPPAAR